ncbi:OmpP1/FadL family transporter [Bacteroides ihuae]|uniref:OmpP1/FadL family transporter n=1 Tax=Bacteroides ihuae TaxID=1852362 RepID=UPI0008D97FF8|nr:hypothetical protein [Bacteroides ihuae]
MKRIKLIIAAVCALGGASALNAQTLYDANRLMGSDLNGTARFVGMGGAMGALGGDISTMGTNPAGIGIYRSNDAMMSFGFNNTNAKSVSSQSTKEINKIHGSFDNAGFVITNKISNNGGLRFVNFGFNYHKLKSFDKDMTMNDSYKMSQTNLFASTVNDNSKFLAPDILIGKNAYFQSDVPWLGALAYEANLIIPNSSNEYDPYFESSRHTVNGQYHSKERGGLNAYDFNVAFNLYDRFYLGATLTAYSIDYTRNTSYSETFMANNEDDGNYTLRNNYKLDGSGVDFKLGFIARPFDESPLRIGMAIHTPIFYSLEENGMAYLDYDTYSKEQDKFISGTAYTQNEYGDEMEGRTKYELTTPWKYNLSLGYTIGKSVALGAEYEYSDYSTAKLKYDDGVKMASETNGIKAGLKGVHTMRLGAEFKFIPEFAFRLGYNYITSSMYSDTFKPLALNSIRTDTEFSNIKAINNYTIGVGYRGQVFYTDLAYQYNTYKEDFYPFYNNSTDGIVAPNATKVTNTKSQVLLTLGMRF